MKVSNDIGLENFIKTRISHSDFAPFERDLMKLIRIYSTYQIIEKAASSENKALTLGEFSVVASSLEAISNNINALSAKFTGLKKDGLTVEESTAQENLLGDSSFKNIISVFFPEGSNWFGMDRLNMAHGKKSYFEFFEENKVALKEYVLVQSRLKEVASDIKALFENLLPEQDIKIFNLAGDIAPLTNISKKILQMVQLISRSEYGDLMSAHVQGIIIEEIAREERLSGGSLERSCTNKQLFQFTYEAYKKFLEFCSIEEWNIASGFEIFKQLKDIRDEAAHSYDLKELHNHWIENYTAITRYTGRNKIHEALKSATIRVKDILRTSLAAAEEKAEASKEEEKEVTSSRKKPQKKQTKSKKQTKRPEEEDIDSILKELDSELGKSIKDEIKLFNEENNKQIQALEELFTRLNEMQVVRNSKTYISEPFSEEFYEEFYEPTKVFHELEGKTRTFLNQPFSSQEKDVFLSKMDEISLDNNLFFLIPEYSLKLQEVLRIIFKDPDLKIQILTKLINEGVNLAKVSESVGNLLLLLYKSHSTGIDEKTFEAFELVLKNYPKKELAKLINEEFDFTKDDLFLCTTLMYRDQEITVRLIKGTLLTLITKIKSNQITFKLQELLINSGASINAELTLTEFTETKKPQDIKVNLITIALASEDYPLTLKIIEHRDFDPKKSFFNGAYLGYTENLEVLSVILDTIFLGPAFNQGKEISSLPILFDIVKALYEKQKDPNFSSSIEKNLENYKLALEKGGTSGVWFSELLLKDPSGAIVKEAFTSSDYPVIEKALLLKCKLKTQKVFSLEDWKAAKDLAPTQKFIIESSSPDNIHALIKEAISKHDNTSIKTLLDNKALEKAGNGASLLFTAIFNKDQEAVALLLQHGEVPNDTHLKAANSKGIILSSDAHVADSELELGGEVGIVDSHF